MTEDSAASIVVEDDPEGSRYVARWGESVAGIAVYRLAQDLIVFTHTEVDPAFEGRGVGGVLVRGALDDVRTRGLRVLALCPFVKGWLAKHPDYQDLQFEAPASTAHD